LSAFAIQEKPPSGDYEQLLTKYHAELIERSTCADTFTTAGIGIHLELTLRGSVDGGFLCEYLF